MGIGGRGRAKAKGRWSTGAIGMLGLTVALVVAGCTSTPPSADDVVTVTSTVGAAADPAMAADPATTASSSGPVVVPPLNGPTSESTYDPQSTDIEVEPTSSVAPTSTSTSTTTPTKTAPPKPKPKPKPKPTSLGTLPVDGATKVDPLASVVVSASGGKLLYVGLVTPSGRVIGGTLNKTRTIWRLEPELGYDKTYRIVIRALAKDGTQTKTESRFTTVAARHLVTVVDTVPKAGSTSVGVGQPIVLHFDRAFADPADRRKVEAEISVQSTTRQGGAFRWFSNTELHWRPAVFWRGNTQVTVTVKIYGKYLGNDGSYGGRDTTFRFKTARSMVAVVDAKSHEMTIFRGGKLIQRFPVSLGTDKYPTYNGIHIVAEHYVTKVMDSRTWGLVGAGAYRTRVKWATRISSSGEFVHGAPWSEYAQGNSNVSHGCINVTDARARWFYYNFIPGDPVIVKNSVGPQLDPGDGFGDWQIPFAKY